MADNTGNIYSYSAPPSPLGAASGAVGMLGGIADIARTQQQTKLLQQTYQAQQALPQVVQSAMRPDGSMDWDKAAIHVATNPVTGPLGPDFAEKLLRSGLVTQQTLGAEIENNAREVAGIKGIIGAGMSEMIDNGGTYPKKSDGTADLTSMHNAAAPVIAAGGPTADLATKLLMAGQGQSPETVGQFVQNTSSGLGFAEQGMNALRQRLEAQGVGGGVYTGFVNPTQTEPTWRPLTAAQQAPTNALGATAAPQGNLPPGMTMMGGGPQNNAAPGTPGASAQLGAAGPRATPGVAMPGGSPQGIAPGAPIMSSVGPYQSGALSNIATNYEPELNSAAAGSRNLLTIIKQARGYMKDFHPGGGQSFLNDLATLAQSAGVDSKVIDKIVGAHGGGLGSVQAFGKTVFGIGSLIAGQYARAGEGRLAQTMWGRTMAEGAPQMNLDERAINNIFHSMGQIANLKNMELRNFNRYKSEGRDLSQWNDTWNNGIYPELVNRMMKQEPAGAQAQGGGGG